MDEIKRKGTTIVIVSHSLGKIVELCNRSIWIDDGCIRMDGDPKQVVNAYLTASGQKPLKDEEGEE